jgi:heptosyltransferase III
MPTAASNHLLILRPGAIGDTLLTFPALAAIRQRCPGTRITVVGNRAALALGKANGLLDEADAFGADWVSDLFGDEPTPRLRSRLAQYDRAIVWLHSGEAASDLAGRLERAGVRDVLPLVSFPQAGSGRHLADHLVATLAPLGISGTRPLLTLSVSPPPGDGQAIEERLIVLHPGAGGRRKRWPAERFAVLADRFAAQGYAVELTSGPADEDAVAAVLGCVRNGQLRVLAGRTLEDLAAILARARLFIGNDSGITHLAGLLGTPTLAIFGPFDPAYWAPLGPRVAVVDAGQDCTHRQDPRDGCRSCDLLPGVSIDLVWNTALSLLG